MTDFMADRRDLARALLVVARNDETGWARVVHHPGGRPRLPMLAGLLHTRTPGELVVIMQAVGYCERDRRPVAGGLTEFSFGPADALRPPPGEVRPLQAPLPVAA